MDKLDMSLWKILRVSQLSWTNRSRSDLSGREGLSSLQVQQSIWTQKEWWRGLFVICTECATDSSCVCHLASWHYHQSKVFLDLARILEVAACTLLPHALYFLPKNWVKKGEIGHTLGPMCIQGECRIFLSISASNIWIWLTSTQRASNVFDRCEMCRFENLLRKLVAVFISECQQLEDGHLNGLECRFNRVDWIWERVSISNGWSNQHQHILAHGHWVGCAYNAFSFESWL